MKVATLTTLLTTAIVATTCSAEIINYNATSTSDSAMNLFSIAVFEQSASCQIVMTDNLLSSTKINQPIRSQHWKRSMEEDINLNIETKPQPIPSSSSHSPTRQLLLTPSNSFNVEKEKSSKANTKNMDKNKTVIEKIWAPFQTAGKCIGEFCATLEPVNYGYVDAQMIMAGVRPMRPIPERRHSISDTGQEQEKREFEQAVRNSLKHRHSGDSKMFRVSSSIKFKEGQDELVNKLNLHIGKGKSAVEWKPIFSHEMDMVKENKDGTLVVHGSSSRLFPLYGPEQEQAKIEASLKPMKKGDSVKPLDKSTSVKAREYTKARIQAASQLLRRRKRGEILGRLFKMNSLQETSASPTHPDDHDTSLHPHALERSTTGPTHRLVKRAVIPEIRKEEKRNDLDGILLLKRGGPSMHDYILQEASKKSPAQQAKIAKYLKHQYGSRSFNHQPLNLDELGLPILPKRTTSLSPQAQKELDDRWEERAKEILDYSHEQGISQDPEKDLKKDNWESTIFRTSDSMSPEEKQRKIDEYVYKYHGGLLAAQLAEAEKANHPHGKQDKNHLLHQGKEKPTSPAEKSKPTLQRSTSFSGPIRYNTNGKMLDPKKYAVYSGPFDKYDKKKKDDKKNPSNTGASKKVGMKKDEPGSEVENMTRIM